MANDGHGTTVPSGTQSVTANVPTAISATPDSGYAFDEWGATGNAYIESPTSASTIVTLTDEDDTITAYFTEISSPSSSGPIFDPAKSYIRESANVAIEIPSGKVVGLASAGLNSIEPWNIIN
jgi:hypothetical protein